MNTGIIASRYATALLKLVDETGSGESVAAQVQVIEAALDGSQEFRHAVADPAVSPESKLGLFEAAVASSGAGLSSVAEPVEAPEETEPLSSAGTLRQAQRPAGASGVLAPELRKFIQLLIRNGRIGDARLVFTTFITEFYRSRHIKRARLIVADASLLSPAASSVAEFSSVAEPVEAHEEPFDSEPLRTSGTLRQAQRPDEQRPAETPSLETRLRDVIESKTGCKLDLKTEVDPTLIGGFIFEVDDLLLDASVSRQIDIIRRQFIEKNRRIV